MCLKRWTIDCIISNSHQPENLLFKIKFYSFLIIRSYLSFQDLYVATWLLNTLYKNDCTDIVFNFFLTCLKNPITSIKIVRKIVSILKITAFKFSFFLFSWFNAFFDSKHNKYSGKLPLNFIYETFNFLYILFHEKN